MNYKGYQLRKINTTGKQSPVKERTHSMSYEHTHDYLDNCRACYIEKLTQRFKTYDLDK